MVNRAELEGIARGEFADIVIDVHRIDAKLHMLLIDEHYIDFWWSEVQEGRFAHHWNRQHVNGTIHRHDNSPHRKWRHIKTFPQHYHREREDSVTESFLPSEPQKAVRAFLAFCREVIHATQIPPGDFPLMRPLYRRDFSPSSPGARHIRPGRINQGIPAELQRSYEDFSTKRRAAALTPEQHAELLQLTDRSQKSEFSG